ncbi:MAG: hypothetical protein IIT55_07350 [Bacteroidaceae bacterium]|nr:hypothetical protein [Bacteroidaceae bacterium]
MELGGIPYLLVFWYLGVFDGVFWFFHRLCGIFFVTLQDIRAKAEPSLTEKVKKNENKAIAFSNSKTKKLKTENSN